jgi:hypothetical protein
MRVAIGALDTGSQVSYSDHAVKILFELPFSEAQAVGRYIARSKDLPPPASNVDWWVSTVMARAGTLSDLLACLRTMFQAVHSEVSAAISIHLPFWY